MHSGTGEAPLCAAQYVVPAGFGCAAALQGGLPFPAVDCTTDLAAEPEVVDAGRLCPVTQHSGEGAAFSYCGLALDLPSNQGLAPLLPRGVNGAAGPSPK